MGGTARSWWRTPLVVWAALTAAVVVTQHAAHRALGGEGWTLGELHRGLGGLVQYDGHRYLEIAARGYSYTPGEQSTIAWFPLYPLTIRGVDAIVGDPVVSGVLVTVVASLVALTCYWVWLADRVDTGARTAALVAFALSPYAWFLYGVVYSDALFLAALLGAIVLAESDHPVGAGVVGAAATMCRPAGVVLVPVLLAIVWQRDGVLVVADPPAVPPRFARVVRWLAIPTVVDRSRLRRSSFAPLLSVVGLGAYMGFLWARFGDPFAFASNQSTFHGRVPFLKLTFLSRMWGFAETPVLSSTLLLQALLTAAALASVGTVARRFGFPYALLVLGTVVLVLGVTHDFNGAGRYLLGAFPVLALAGEWIAARRGRRAVLAVSGALMLVMVFGFARGRYLG